MKVLVFENELLVGENQLLVLPHQLEVAFDGVSEVGGVNDRHPAEKWDLRECAGEGEGDGDNEYAESFLHLGISSGGLSGCRLASGAAG